MATRRRSFWRGLGLVAAEVSLLAACAGGGESLAPDSDRVLRRLADVRTEVAAIEVPNAVGGRAEVVTCFDSQDQPVVYRSWDAEVPSEVAAAVAQAMERNGWVLVPDRTVVGRTLEQREDGEVLRAGITSVGNVRLVVSMPERDAC